MPVTVFALSNLPDRYRGFLLSVALEVTTHVFVAPAMSKSVRERIWSIIEDWWADTPGGGSFLMVFTTEGVCTARVLGEPPREIIELDGFPLSRRLQENVLLQPNNMEIVIIS